MTVINSNEASSLKAYLPVYTHHPLLDNNLPIADFKEHNDQFDKQFHHEIVNLRARRLELSRKIARAQQKAPSPEQKQEIMQEFAALEQSKKILALFADALEKSRQSVAANMR